VPSLNRHVGGEAEGRGLTEVGRDSDDEQKGRGRDRGMTRVGRTPCSRSGLMCNQVLQKIVAGSLWERERSPRCWQGSPVRHEGRAICNDRAQKNTRANKRYNIGGRDSGAAKWALQEGKDGATSTRRRQSNCGRSREEKRVLRKDRKGGIGVSISEL